jgi:hypothetical protein
MIHIKTPAVLLLRLKGRIKSVMDDGYLKATNSTQHVSFLVLQTLLYPGELCQDKYHG